MLQEKLFTDRELWKLVIPLALEQMLFCLVGSVDTMMISSLGEAAVSGVSLVDMVNNFIFNIWAAVATGGAVVVSQYLGAKDQKNALASATQLIMTTFTISLVLVAVTEWSRRWIIDFLFGPLPEDVMAHSMTYFKVTALSFPFMAIYNSCAALMRSMKKTQKTLLAALLSNVLNVIGNSLLIYVCKQGVGGAAAATVFARFCSMLFLMYLLTDQRNPIYITRHGWGKADWTLIHKILYIGIPSGIENSVFQFGRLIVVGVIATFGTTQITANAVANNLDFFGTMFGGAFCLATITVIGQSVGAGDEEQVRFYVRKMMKMSYTAHILWNIVLFCIMPYWLNLYSMSDETAKMALWLVVIHNGFGSVMWPFAFVFPNVLRAANDVRFTMFASIGSMVVWRIGFSYVLGRGLGWGAYGVWWAMVIDWACRIVCFVWRYCSNGWLKGAKLKS